MSFIVPFDGMSHSVDPFGALVRAFGDEFSSLFDHGPKQTFVRDTSAVANTAVDVKETPEAYHFVADLPGLKREEVKVEVEEGNVLSISGQRTREEKQQSDQYHSVERSTGKFLRRFTLPKNVVVDHISAKCENGVLSVTVPKLPPKKPKTFEVQIA